MMIRMDRGSAARRGFEGSREGGGVQHEASFDRYARSGKKTVQRVGSAGLGGQAFGGQYVHASGHDQKPPAGGTVIRDARRIPGTQQGSTEYREDGAAGRDALAWLYRENVPAGFAGNFGEEMVVGFQAAVGVGDEQGQDAANGTGACAGAGVGGVGAAGGSGAAVGAA